jgi:hypothetical protein
MQTKFSYRTLKFAVFMGMAAALASACVVSSGDGDDDPFGVDGGEGGTDNTSGTKNTGGTKAGTSGSGGTTSTSGTGGTTTTEGGGAGEGGVVANPDYPGVCDSSLKQPSVINDAACTADDADNPCGACLKKTCCEAFKTCYGKEPTSACGYGTSPDKIETDRGQFDCIVACYERDNDGVKDEAEILDGCQTECLNQCAATDDFINEDTNNLMGCALNGTDDDPAVGDDCHDECFPPPM